MDNIPHHHSVSTAPVYTGTVPAYFPHGSPLENTAIRMTWQKRTTDWMEDVSMNKALMECCLTLLLQEHRDLHQHTFLDNPNCGFEDTFNYFYREYCICNKMEPTQCREKEKRFQTLRTGLKSFTSALIKRFSLRPLQKTKIYTGNALNLPVNDVLKTGIFHILY